LVPRRQETEDGAAMQPDDFPEIDTRTASVARVYDYMLGGTDNYEIDRRAADMGEDLMPGSFALTRNNRRYLERVVHYLAGECGIRQFIDNGSGLPTQNNVHQVAQKAGPGSKVVYVEIDPVVLAHGRVKALLAEDDSTAFIQADACDVGRVLSHPDTQRLIDFDEPVAVLYFSFLHSIPDARDPGGVVRQMTDRLAPGSYLAISHFTSDDPEFREKATRFILESLGGDWGRVRSREEVAEFFDGLEIVPPGLVKAVEWHPDGREEEQSPNWFEYGGVARKP
jgi:SAM-dependent methyltransferase